MAGRKAVPIAIVSKGNQHLTKEQIELRENGEPKGAPTNLIPPPQLKGEAKKEWKRLIEIYKVLNPPVLNDLDLGILCCYCEAWAAYHEALAKKDSMPLVVSTTSGYATNPYLKIMDKESANIAKYGEQLCLTPVGRARMGMANTKKKEEEGDPMEALLKRGRSG